jgi:hypothetical protein
MCIWSHCMCWDVTICKFPREIETIEQLPDNFKPSAIAPRKEIAQLLKRLFPDTDVSDLSWLVIDRQDFKIEINTGHNELCEGLTLHVRGSDEALGAVTQITRCFEARAFDMTACQFLDRMNNPTSGLRQWRKYTHRIAGAVQHARAA